MSLGPKIVAKRAMTVTVARTEEEMIKMMEKNAQKWGKH